MTTFDLNAGAMAPVMDELDLTALTVSGRLPPDLDGTLVRNGPNPVSGRFEGNDMLSWWPEAAMLHGVTFAHGRAVGYRNRWVRTERWARVHSPADAHDTSLWPDTNPNVNVIGHAGEILALSEGGAPLAMTAALDTVGPSRRLGGFAPGMTAHPKLDPRTGELVTYRAAWQPPFLRYGVVDADGVTQVDIDMPMASPSMIHDMAITATHAVLFDGNVSLDLSMLAHGHRMPLRWHDERRSRLGVMPRQGGEMRWFDIAPCCILHVVNAFDVAHDRLVVDVMRYPWFLRLSADGRTFEDNPLATLWRYEVDLSLGTVAARQVSDVAMEMPRIDERFTGQLYRQCYAVEQPSTVEMRGVVRYDWQTGVLDRYQAPDGNQNGEPVFVPRAGGTEEGDGWVLCCVHRQATDTTDVIVLDGRALAAGPVATVHLPVRVPAGFHGTWLPGGPKRQDVRQRPLPPRAA